MDLDGDLVLEVVDKNGFDDNINGFRLRERKGEES